MDAYMGEVRAFGFQYAPEGWLECNGQLYSIQQYQGLFAVIGTIYGGDGKTTFGVPDLRGNAVVGSGQGTGLTLRTQGQSYGHETVALNQQSQMAVHHHTMVMEVVGISGVRANTLATPVAGSSWLSRPVQVTGDNSSNSISNFSKDPVNTPLHPSTLGANPGSGQAHENRQPYLPMIYCINWNGYFPSPAD